MFPRACILSRGDFLVVHIWFRGSSVWAVVFQIKTSPCVARWVPLIFWWRCSHRRNLWRSTYSTITEQVAESDQHSRWTEEKSCGLMILIRVNIRSILCCYMVHATKSIKSVKLYLKIRLKDPWLLVCYKKYTNQRSSSLNEYLKVVW